VFNLISKKQYCELIIEDFCRSEAINREELKEGDVFKSSCLGVAMEYLGLINDQEILEYVATRGGVLDTYVNAEEKVINVLSTRDMLSLLPDEVENQWNG
jgi:hypothetical protein